MKKIFAGFAILFPLLAFANPTALTAKEIGWQVKFEAPPTERIEEQSTSNFYRYVGSTGNFNISLYIESPQCAGDASSGNQLRCFFSRIEQVPGVVKQSIRTSKLPNAVQVSYLTYARTGDAAVKVLHSHILFADKGKWGDLHGSVVKPDASEIAMLLALGDAFSFTN